MRIDENPVFYESLRDRLLRIINDYRENRINSAEQLKLLMEILEDVRTPEKHAMKLGVDTDVAPFYELVATGSDDGDDLKSIAKEIHACLKELTVVDWQQKRENTGESKTSD